MLMKKITKKKGILFWITGLSGSGKTTIAKKITPKIKKIFGPTIFVSGDDLRSIFNLKNYSKSERLKIGINYSKFSKFITDQGINVVFAVIGLFEKLRAYNKKNIKNYVEIYIESNTKNLVKFSKKKHYKKNSNNVWGIDLKPQLPKKPDIRIINNFEKNLNQIELEIMKKLKKLKKLK